MKTASSQDDRDPGIIERVGSMSWVWITLVAAVLAYSSILWIEMRQDRLLSYLRNEQTLLRQARVDLAKGYLHISLGGRSDSPFDRAQGLALLGQAHSSLEKAVRLQMELEGKPASQETEEARSAQFEEFVRAVEQFRGLVTGREDYLEPDSALITELRIAFFALERQAEQVETQIQQDLSATMHRYDFYRKMMTGGAGILLAMICLSAFAGDRARKRTESQRREAEEIIRSRDARLREAEKQYRDLWEKAPVMMISLDSQARINFVSDRFCEELGYRQDEVLGKTPFAFQTAESAHYAQSVVFPQFLKEGAVKDAPLQLVRADGEVIDVLLNVTAERDAQAKVVRSRSVFTDITMRKRAEKKLIESEQMFKVMAETSPLAIYASSDIEQKAEYINPTFERLLGYKIDDIPSAAQWWPLAYPEDAYRHEIMMEWQRRVEHAIENKTNIEPLETVVTCKDGSRKHIVWGYISTSTQNYTFGLDITERKQAENALRASLDEKIALLKEVHHRVKNNLQIVASLLGLQARRATSGEVTDMLLDTRNRVKSMALLHETLYRSGNLAGINFATYLKDLCGQLLISYSMASRRVRLEYHIIDVQLSLEHAVPCGLIVSELVSNSLKHGFPDNRTGRIMVGLEAAEDKMLILRVEDDGVGLPANLDISGKSTLGLKLVSGLVDQLSGRMTFTNGRDAGASFHIHFPLPDNS